MLCSSCIESHLGVGRPLCPAQPFPPAAATHQSAAPLFWLLNVPVKVLAESLMLTENSILGAPQQPAPLPFTHGFRAAM